MKRVNSATPETQVSSLFSKITDKFTMNAARIKQC